MFLAFKEKKRFYKLKNGSFLDLEDSETKDLFELVENLNVSSLMTLKFILVRLYILMICLKVKI